MTKREKILLISSIIMVLTGAGIFLYKKDSGSSSDGMLRIDLTSVKQDSGWGYRIRVGDNYAIYQNHIPAIPGYKMFVSEAEALKTGQLVVERIKHKKPMTITVYDLKALGIHY